MAVRLLLGCYGLVPGVEMGEVVELIETIATQRTDVSWIAEQLAVRPVRNG